MNLNAASQMCVYWSKPISFSARFIDRPEQRISLDDFKSFLLESQKVISLDCWTSSLLQICFICTLHYICVCLWIQEMWATDSNMVQEFMFSYLKDPLREVEQPYFHQDEVHVLSLPPHFLITHFVYSIHSLLSGFLVTSGKKTCFCELCFPMQPPALLVYVGDAQELTWIAMISA